MINETSIDIIHKEVYIMGIVGEITLFEFKRLMKSKLFWVAFVCIVVLPIMIDSPLTKGYTFLDASAAYFYAHGACFIGSLFVSICVISLYYYENTTQLYMVIFSQPIKRYEYCIAKFLGGFFLVMFTFILGIIVQILLPLIFRENPYVPYKFIESFIIYILPSMLFIMAMSYFIYVLTNSILFNVLFTIAYVFFQDIGFDEKYKYFSRGEYLNVLASGEKWSKDFANYIAINRFLYIVISVVLLIITLVIYEYKKNTEIKGGV